ncbi:MAG TPA: hypothetical protein VHC94_19235 [Nitrobacter sp.]|nr:hypothetical protein [Nitrobacter sp.]
MTKKDTALLVKLMVDGKVFKNRRQAQWALDELARLYGVTIPRE